MPFKDPEKQREANRRWYAKNREREQAKRRGWHEEDRERSRASSRRYYEENRESVLARTTQWKQDNPEMAREHGRKNSRNRRIALDPLNTVAVGWIQILEGDPCAYCGGPMEEVDHIVPVKHDGTNDWDNLAATCKSCNASKYTRSLLEYLLCR